MAISATDEQIVAAFLENGNFRLLCKNLHTRPQRAERVLAAAGIHRVKRKYTPRAFEPKARSMPEAAAAAIADYKAGAAIRSLEEKYGVSSTQLYRWMDRSGVPRRSSAKFWCWECGGPAPKDETFCCDDHRREYDQAVLKPGFMRPPPRRIVTYAQASRPTSLPKNGYQPGRRYSC